MSEPGKPLDEQAKHELLEPAHHRQIEASFEALRTQMRIEDDLPALRACWDRFERQLDEHMCAEEQYLLPRFADEHPKEAQALRQEHDNLRRIVAELGVSVDLHSISAEQADRLIDQLVAHAAREDLVLYPWAATHLPSWRDVVGLALSHPSEAWLELHRLADETRLRLHLAKLEVRAEFERIELEMRRQMHGPAQPLLEELRALAKSI